MKLLHIGMRIIPPGKSSCVTLALCTDEPVADRLVSRHSLTLAEFQDGVPSVEGVPAEAAGWLDRMRGATCGTCLQAAASYIADAFLRDAVERAPWTNREQFQRFLMRVEDAAAALKWTETRVLGELSPVFPLPEGKRVQALTIIDAVPESEQRLVMSRLDAIIKRRAGESDLPMGDLP